MTIRALAVGNNNTDQVDHRSLITGLAQPSGPVGIRPGVFPSITSPASLSNVSAMVVGVGALKAIILNQSGSGQHLVQSDSTVNLTFADGESTVTRTDRIIVRVYNNDQDSSGISDAAIEYLKGQASGTATAVPNGALLLWEVPVPQGASAGGGGINFTSIAVDKRVYTTALGGVIPVASNTELAAISNPYQGMAAYAKDNNFLYVFDGSSWRIKGQASVASSANLSNIANPYDGLLATTRDTNAVYQYNGSAWVIVTGGTGPIQSKQQFLTDGGTTNSTSFTGTLSGGATPGVVFVAPLSGAVEVGWSASFWNNTSGQTSQCSWELRTGGTIGSGTIVPGYDAQVYHQVATKHASSSNDFQAGDTFLVEGLTPGSTYNVRQMYAVSGGTATFSRKKIKVVPVT